MINLLGLVAWMLWMLVGYLASAIVFAAHIIRAESEGCKAEETWDKMISQNKAEYSTLNRTFALMWGLLWWPYYVTKMHRTLNECYEYYERYERR